MIKSNSLLIHSAIDWKLIVSVVVLTVMVLLRDLEIVPFNQWIFVGVVSLSCVILPYNSLTAYSCFLIPFFCAIHGLMAYPIYIMLLFKSRHKTIGQFVFPAIILILELFHFSEYTFKVEIAKYITYAPYILFFFYLLFDNSQKDENLKKNIYYYIIGVTTILLIIVIHSLIVYGPASLLLGDFRIGGDLDNFEASGEVRYTFMNSNTLAYFSITAFVLLLYGESVFKGKLVYKVIPAIVIIFAGILSTSRTWILLMALLLFVYFMLTGTKGKLKLIVAAIALLIVAEQFTEYSENLTTRFTDRFQSDNIETAGERTELLKAYNDFMLENPSYMIFGTGSVYYKNVCNVWNSTHNGVQQIFVSYGVFGLLIYLACAVAFIKLFVSKMRHEKLLWKCMPFFTCFLFDLSIQFLNPCFLMLPFIVVLIPLKLKREWGKNVY